MVRDCPQPMKCFNCQQEGHQSKDCTNESEKFKFMLQMLSVVFY